MLFLKALVYFNGMDNAKIFLLLVKGIHNCNIILALPEHKKRGRRRRRRRRRISGGGGGGGSAAVDLCNVLSQSDAAILNMNTVKNILKECLPLNFMPIKFKQLRAGTQ